MNLEGDGIEITVEPGATLGVEYETGAVPRPWGR